MARSLYRLGARSAATLKKPGLHADGGGLYLRIDRPTAKDLEANPDAVGPKRWVFIFQWRGKRTEMGLGSAATLMVKDARDKRDAARKLLDAHQNPIEARRLVVAAANVEEAPAVNFGAFADEWFEARKADWSSKTTQDRWRRILEHHCLPLRPLPLDSIGTKEVEDTLRPIWDQIPELAARVRGGIEDVLDAARVKGLRSGDNPARWKGHLAHILSAPKRLTRGHHPAMPYDDVPAFVARLRAHSASSARLVEFTILTVSRPTEAREASWAEFADSVWTAPAGRMKERREHRVPLSSAAVSVLDLMRPYREEGDGGWVFVGSKPGRPFSNMAAERLMDSMGAGAFTIHGFRSSFRDWAGDRTTFAREVIEAALAHMVGDEAERAYRRGDALEKRRKLMDAWAAFLAKPLEGRRHGPG